MTGIIDKADADFPKNAKFKFYLCINKKYIHAKFKTFEKTDLFLNLIMQNFLRMRNNFKHLCSSPNALGKIPGNVCESSVVWHRGQLSRSQVRQKLGGISDRCCSSFLGGG